MSPEERDQAYLFDMLDAARSARGMVAGARYEEYLSDDKLRSAVERKLEILGEAARRVSTGLRDKNPEIPWRSIIGLRNVLLHEYGEVDQGRIWKIVTSDVPELIRSLERLLPPPSPGQV
jgi:uncharacterized protein with HEPN domain